MPLALSDDELRIVTDAPLSAEDRNDFLIDVASELAKLFDRAVRGSSIPNDPAENCLRHPLESAV